MHLRAACLDCHTIECGDCQQHHYLVWPTSARWGINACNIHTHLEYCQLAMLAQECCKLGFLHGQDTSALRNLAHLIVYGTSAPVDLTHLLLNHICKVIPPAL
jgi:hypothetical protein